MKMSESIIELSKALSKFQGEVVQPKKDGTNPHFKSQFVSLDGVVAAITDTAPKYGLSFLQFPLNEENKVGVKTLILHDSGEWIEGSPIFTQPMKNDPQALGAVLTYLRRYSLAAIFGITSETDDDAEGAMDRNSNTYQPPKNNTTPSQNNKPSGGYTKTVKPTNAQEAAAIVMSGGKHAGKTLKEVFTTDKSYVKWMLESEKTDPNIKEGIELMQVAIAQQNAAKSMNQ